MKELNEIEMHSVSGAFGSNLLGNIAEAISSAIPGVVIGGEHVGNGSGVGPIASNLPSPIYTSPLHYLMRRS